MLRIDPVEPLDVLVDRRACGLRVIGTGKDAAVGVQRPVRVPHPVRAAVYLKLPAAAAVERAHGELDLARRLLGKNDRLVEEDVLDPGRRPGGGQRHRGVGRTRDDDRAVDDVVRQPGLGLDRHHGGVDGVPGSEILCAAEDSGHPHAVGAGIRHPGGLGPVATALERIGGQLKPLLRRVMHRGKVRPVPTDIRRGDGFGDLT